MKLSGHRLERWEYDLAGKLMLAVLEDDRPSFDAQLAAANGEDAMDLHADLIVIGLGVCVCLRWPAPLVHVRPREKARAELVDTLTDSQFADLLDLDMAILIVNRLYQRGLPDPFIPSIDLTSATTFLAVGAWRLWHHWALLPRDRCWRAERAYAGVAAGMRLRRVAVHEWVRQPPPATAGCPSCRR